jgi:hypothetical protein
MYNARNIRRSLGQRKLKIITFIYLDLAKNILFELIFITVSILQMSGLRLKVVK